MADVDTKSPLLAGIDKAIEEIEQRVRQEQEAERSAPGAARGGSVAAPAPAAPQPVSPQQSIEDLSLFLSRLKQIRDWLQQDIRLLPVVDEFIGKKVSQSEKRSNRNNLVLAGVTTVVGAVLGWLVSALGTPDALLRLAGH